MHRPKPTCHTIILLLLGLPLTISFIINYLFFFFNRFLSVKWWKIVKNNHRNFTDQKSKTQWYSVYMNEKQIWEKEQITFEKLEPGNSYEMWNKQNQIHFAYSGACKNISTNKKEWKTVWKIQTTENKRIKDKCCKCNFCLVLLYKFPLSKKIYHTVW